MTPNTSIDTTGLSNFIGAYQKVLLEDHYIESEIPMAFTVDTTVTNEKKYTKRKVTSDPREFDDDYDPTGNLIKYTETGIVVKAYRDDYKYSSEDYRKTFFGQDSNISLNQTPDFEGVLGNIVKNNVQAVCYATWGASLLNPNTMPKMMRSQDGVNEQVRKALLSVSTTGIIPYTSGAITGGVLNGYQGTSGNALVTVQAMDKLSPLYKSGKARYALMSYPTYNKIVNDIKVSMLSTKTEEELKSDGPLGRGIYVEESDGLLMLMPLRLAKSSNRIIITNKENIVFGTDLGNQDFSFFEIDKRLHHIEMSAKIVWGIKILNFEDVVANELA